MKERNIYMNSNKRMSQENIKERLERLKVFFSSLEKDEYIKGRSHTILEKGDKDIVTSLDIELEKKIMTMKSQPSPPKQLVFRMIKFYRRKILKRQRFPLTT